MPESVAWTSTVSEGISDEAAGDPLYPASPTANKTAAALRIAAVCPPNVFMCTPILLKPAAVERQQFAQNFLVRDVRRRTLRHGHGRVKGRMRVDKLPWTRVSGVRQRSLLERVAASSSRGTGRLG